MLSQINLDLPVVSPSLKREMFLALVVNNDDPDALCRVKVRIPEIHGEIPEEHLPWAVQFRPVAMGAGANLSGYCVPRLGTTVVVTHHHGDIYSPIYHAEPYLGLHGIGDIRSNYPNSYGWRDGRQNSVQVNMERNNLSAVFGGDVRGDVIATPMKTGSAVLNIQGSLYIKPDGKAILQVGKDLIISTVDDSDERIGISIITPKHLRESVGEDSVEIIGRDKAIKVGGDLSVQVMGDEGVQVQVSNGTTILIDPNGNVSISNEGTLTSSSVGAISISTEGGLTINAEGNVVVNGSGKVVVNSDDVRLGDESSANKALVKFDEMKDKFDNHTHLVNAAQAVSPPIGPPTPAHLTSKPRGTSPVTANNLGNDAKTDKVKGT